MTAKGDLTYCKSNTGGSGFDVQCSKVALSTDVDVLQNENINLEQELGQAKVVQDALKEQVATVEAAFAAEKVARAKDAEAATAAIASAESKIASAESKLDKVSSAAGRYKCPCFPVSRRSSSSSLAPHANLLFWLVII